MRKVTMGKPKATKESVLELTNDGLRFYKYVIPQLEVKGSKCKNVKNPFYGDGNGSVSIYYEQEKEQWFFKDFGDEEFGGDVFQFASYFFDLRIKEDFPEILDKMYRLDYSKIQTKNLVAKPVEHISKKEYKLFRREDDKFKPHELKYFGRIGVTEGILNEYNVIPINGYSGQNSKGEAYTTKRGEGQVMVAYLQNGCAKIYCPNPKRFLYLGNKPRNYIFGGHLMFNQNTKVVFITGGEKDVMAIAGLGHRAICFNSETELPSREIIKEYFYDGVKFYTLLDNDPTGIKQSERYINEFGIKPFKIPKEILDRGGKDISDYVELGLTPAEFDKILGDFIRQSESNNLEIAKPLVSEIKETTKMFDTDCLPDSIYDNLPPLFTKCCDVFKTPREKDIVLLSSIVMMGSIYKNINGLYKSDYVGTNLYLFVVAPASSGKGVLKYPRFLGDKIHKTLKSLSLEAIKEYRENKKKNKGEDYDDTPEPELTTFFIPANSSATSVLKQLSTNEGYGIIYETEADTLADALAKDWSNFSDALRKAFHHETISYQRRTDKELVEIDNPNNATVLCGTPNQVKTLMPSTENGLFSRFCFYAFESEPVWEDVFEKNTLRGIKHTGLNEKETDPVYDILVECMQNTNNHASLSNYGNCKWWLNVFNDPNEKVSKYSFVDLGVGIFQSMVFKNYLDKIVKLTPFHSNIKFVDDLLNGKIQSRMDEDNEIRGKGIPQIVEYAKTHYFREFYIISNDVKINVKTGEKFELKNNLKGTFLYWELYNINDNGN